MEPLLPFNFDATRLSTLQSADEQWHPFLGARDLVPGLLGRLSMYQNAFVPTAKSIYQSVD